MDSTNDYEHQTNDHDDYDTDLTTQTNKRVKYTNEISREDLAAAYLTGFFDGRITQSTVSNFLSISNITSEVKLPTSFDGLINLLIGTANYKKFKKAYYCSNCLSTIETLNSRYQRVCEKCFKRLAMYYICDIEKQRLASLNQSTLTN